MQYLSHRLILNIITIDRLTVSWLDVRVVTISTQQKGLVRTSEEQQCHLPILVTRSAPTSIESPLSMLYSWYLTNALYSYD